MEKLTVAQLANACKKNKYLAARYVDNDVIGINCGIANLSKIKKDLKKRENNITNYVSFRPVTFMEYLSIKTKF